MGGSVMLHSLYLARERRGTDLWAERITHRYERDQVRLVISDAKIRRPRQITTQVGLPMGGDGSPKRSAPQALPSRIADRIACAAPSVHGS
jgi:hypothetical protein